MSLGQTSEDQMCSKFIDAVDRGNLRAVKAILNKCDDNQSKIDVFVNARDDDGFSVLTHAVAGKRMDMIEALLISRADPNATDRSGCTPLHVAAQMGGSTGLSIVRKLLRHNLTNPNARMKDGSTALLFAVHESHTKIAARLLKAHADPNIKGGPQEHTCLHEAILHSNRGIFRLLLKAQANPNLTDHYGVTPLLAAVEHDLKFFARKLIVAQADMNAKSDDGTAAIHLAASSPNDGMLRMLLDTGSVNINAQDGRGNTAMILAAENPASCNIDMVKDLILGDPNLLPSILPLPPPPSSP